MKEKIAEIAGGETQLILYGSYARGESREDSDVDLMVILPDAVMTPEFQEIVADAIFETGLETDFLFTPLIVSESQARRFTGFKVFASVEKEGIPV